MKNLETDIPLLTEVGQYILGSGGKRIRPALLLFATGLIGNIHKNACQAANIIEYIHTATLLHDDVVDNAALRRSKRTARTIWGNEASVLVGDYLFTVSFRYLAEFKSLRMVEELSKATTLMARGEILQLTKNNESATEEDYLEIIYHKTASLMGAAMAMGVISNDGTPAEQKALYECGRDIGMAFQLIDDALDYKLDNQKLGKQQGADLKERKITLPLSHLLQNASSQDRERVIEILDEEEILDQHVTLVGELLQAYNSLEYTKNRAKEYVDKAKLSIQHFPDNQYKKGITELADFIVFRNQ
jgi:octaprenyl-diphosphate synthase